MSSFISMCLRSVHTLLSFRFGGRCSYLTPRPPFTTLRSVYFTHLSTARHKWLLHSTPQINAVIPFRLTAVILTQILLPQTASKASFHSPTHCCVAFSHHTCPFPTHFQLYIFSTATSPPPINCLKAERKVITPNRCVVKLRQSENKAPKITYNFHLRLVIGSNENYKRFSKYGVSCQAPSSSLLVV